MSNVYKAGNEVHGLVRDLIANHHPDLVLVEERIVVLFREKAKKTGDGREVEGTASKVSPRLAIWTDNKYDFLFQIEIPVPLWNQWNDQTRLAVLDHFLCSMRAEEDEESGETKFYICPPDISFHSQELSRYGEYRPVPDDAYLALERLAAAKAAVGQEVGKRKKPPPRLVAEN